MTALAEHFRQQAEQCRSLGSPLTAALLDGAAGALDRPGPVRSLLAPLEGDPPGSARALRFAAALHRLVLERRAPALAVHYPSVGGTPGAPEALWATASGVVEEHLGALHELVRRPVQTNEVGRSSALLGALLHVADTTGMPVVLLEMGASAGLNLHVDRFRHEVAPGTVLGDPSSPVVLDAAWDGALPPLGTRLRVLDRVGCDPAPIDPARTEDRLTLTSCVWADQLPRFERLRAALQVAAADPPRVLAEAGSDFLARELGASRPGVATVVWQSIVRQYLPPGERRLVDEALAGAGARASQDAPLAHVALEPGSSGFEVTMTLWPSGTSKVLATAGAHGPPVHWR